jgi:hypothetical protein
MASWLVPFVIVADVEVVFGIHYLRGGQGPRRHPRRGLFAPCV